MPRRRAPDFPPLPPPLPPAGELELILQQVEAALEFHLYYLAIVLTLTLPNVCSGLMEPDGRSTGHHYKAWYEANLASAFPLMSADTCYSLRCGLTHQGQMELAQRDKSHKRVIFSFPDGYDNVIEGRLDDALFFNAANFCETILERVRLWYQMAKDDPNVIKNMPNLVRFRPDGMSPYIKGMPVIA